MKLPNKLPKIFLKKLHELLELVKNRKISERVAKIIIKGTTESLSKGIAEKGCKGVSEEIHKKIKN